MNADFDVVIAELDGTKNQETMIRFNISSYPTLLYFHGKQLLLGR